MIDLVHCNDPFPQPTLSGHPVDSVLHNLEIRILRKSNDAEQNQRHDRDDEIRLDVTPSASAIGGPEIEEESD
jgi:hypothetical protein